MAETEQQRRRRALDREHELDELERDYHLSWDQAYEEMAASLAEESGDEL